MGHGNRQIEHRAGQEQTPNQITSAGGSGDWSGTALKVAPTGAALALALTLPGLGCAEDAEPSTT
jgi:hypothetical protein